MDWRAIEANEDMIREAIAEKMAGGTDRDLTSAAAGRLQLALTRPWLVWVSEERTNPKRLVEAFTDVLGTLVVEVAKNLVRAGAEGSHAEVAVSLLLQISRVACDDATALDDGTHPEGKGEGPGVDLRKQSDA